jgi:phage baseplate assembly protein W
MANVLDKVGSPTAVSTVTKKKPWADLNLSLLLNGFTGDLSPMRDDEAVKNAVRNLVLTNFYERPFQPELAANLRGLLFEPSMPITKIELRQNIKDVITYYEPRIILRAVNILERDENNTWVVIIYFKIKEFDTDSQVEIVLQRLR